LNSRVAAVDKPTRVKTNRAENFMAKERMNYRVWKLNLVRYRGQKTEALIVQLKA